MFPFSYFPFARIGTTNYALVLFFLFSMFQNSESSFFSFFFFLPRSAWPPMWLPSVHHNSLNGSSEKGFARRKKNDTTGGRRGRTYSRNRKTGFFFFFACVHVCFVFCVCVSGLASRFIHLLFLSFYGLRVRVAVAAGASFFPCCVFRSRRLQDGRRGMRLLQSRPLFPRFSFPLTQCDPTRHDACPVSLAFLQELFHEKERVSPQQTTTNKKMNK